MNPEPLTPENGSELEIQPRDLIRAVRSRFWLVLLFAPVGTFLSWVLYISTVPLYRTSSSLLIRDSTSRPEIDVRRRDVESGRSHSDIFRYEAILTSRGFLERVVEQLGLQFRIFIDNDPNQLFYG